MSRTVKLLSDFDGVWTNQRDEAEHIQAFASREIARVTGEDPQRVRSAFDDYVAQIHATPTEFGWAPTGRISAFVDEDPLLVTNSVFLMVHRGADERARSWGEAIRAAGFEALEAFADHCFLGATKTFREAHPPILVDGARETMQALREAGAEVVVISNSRSEKLIAWLGEAGIDAGEGEGHDVRVRGNAKKWFLSDAPEAIEVAGRTVYVDRPIYRAALEAEAPDLVIGDVFSLDLALPAELRARAAAGGPRYTVLRAHPHTPDWIRSSRGDGRIDGIVEHPRELLLWIERLREGR